MSELIPIGKIGKYLGYNIHPATAHRWRERGVMHNDERIYLKAQKIGARHFVDKSDLQAFIAKLNASAPAAEVPCPSPRTKSKEEVDELLDEFGV